MALKPIKRGYSFSDGTLSELGDDLVDNATRDSIQMTTFGYNAAKLATLTAKITAFKEFPGDAYYTGLMMIATATKNNAIKEMGVAGHEIVQRGIIRWGENSAEERTFGFKGYAGMKEPEKINACRDAHKFATDNLDEMTDQGLTEDILEAFKAKIDAADAAFSAKRKSVRNRDAAVDTRIKMGNELYAELVKLAGTGKTIWENTNEAKYNDYVIYASEGVNTVSDSAPANSVHAPSVAITSIGDEIEITVEAGTLTAYFSDDPTDEPAEGQITFTVNVDTPFSGTAAELGWSSTNNRLLLKNAGADPVPFSVVVRG